MYLYVRGYDERGKEIEPPDEIVNEVMKALPVDEVVKIVHGIDYSDVTPSDILRVMVKASKDPSFRNIFLFFLHKYFGDLIKETAKEYIVTQEDIQLFEKLLKETKSTKTAKDRLNYLKRALADLGNTLTPEGLKEYILDLMAESNGKAEHTVKALKLFIKEVVKLRDPALARLLYDSFKTPRGKTKYRPMNLSIDILKRIFNNIQDIGAKAFFLVLAETGLRTGEVLSLTVEQVDLEHRVIKLMKENETKRAYITFLHENTAKWLKEVYLPYREDFVSRYLENVKKLAEANPEQGIDVTLWFNKFFPFRDDSLRFDIKNAMKRVLGREFRLYDLRSFFASYMIKQGVSPMVVNILQGRVPPQQFRILQEHYFVISEEELRYAYEKHAPRIL